MTEKDLKALYSLRCRRAGLAVVTDVVDDALRRDSV